MSFYCHMLYAFLQTKLKTTACQLAELPSAFAAEDSILPSKTSLLSELLISLSDKGVIIFLKNQHHPERSWIVVKKEALLKDIIGTLFAPEDFKEHYPLPATLALFVSPLFKNSFPSISQRC